jgi:amidase
VIGKLSVRSCLDRIAERNGELNAVTVTLADEALAAAERLERDPARPLLGAPFTVKENIDVAGTVTSLGLRGGVPAASDAPHIAHLRAAGAIPVGRGNLPDLALRWHTDNARHGATVNPFDASLSPGGSSGGDAVALASGMCEFAIGSDYGGSLRVPAALAQVYSLRPTPGRLAQSFGAPPLMSRQLMATDGPLARSVEDLALVFSVMAQPGRDPRYTPASLDAGRRVTLVLADDAVRRAGEALSAAGYEVAEAELPLIEEAAQMWLDLVSFEVRLGALARLRAEGSEGTRTSAEALFSLGRPIDYAKALGDWYVLTAKWPRGLVLGPVSTCAPWPVGHDQGGPDALREEWWGFRLTVATACLALPVVSLPSGVQIAGPRWSEGTLLAAAEIIAGA